MKKTNPEIAESTDVKSSSSLITLQLLNKDKEKIKAKEKEESAAEAAKVRCRTCFRETAPKRLCAGHGGGSGGGESAGSDETSEEKASFDEVKSLAEPKNLRDSIDGSEFDAVELDLESSLNPEIIAELIAKGLLLVDNNRESMTLSLKLLCEPKALTEVQQKELKKYMLAIIKEFNEFKKENNLTDDCLHIVQDKEGNLISLRITMPTLVLYDAFIERLANNLVPASTHKIQEKNETTRESNLVNEENQPVFNPSPLNMKPW